MTITIHDKKEADWLDKILSENKPCEGMDLDVINKAGSIIELPLLSEKMTNNQMVGNVSVTDKGVKRV